MKFNKKDLTSKFLECYNHYNGKNIYYLDLENGEIKSVDKTTFEKFASSFDFKNFLKRKYSIDEHFYISLLVENKKRIIPAPYPEKEIKQNYYANERKISYDDYRKKCLIEYIECFFDDRNIFEIKASSKEVGKLFLLLKKLYDYNIFEMFTKENIIRIDFGTIDFYCLIDSEDKAITIETGNEGLSNLVTIINGNKDIDLDVVNCFRNAIKIRLVKENVARETAINNYLKYESPETDFDEYVPCFEIDNYCLRYNDYIRKTTYEEIAEILNSLIFIVKYIKNNDLKYKEKDSFYYLSDKKKVIKTNILNFAVPVCFVNLNPLVGIRNNILVNEYQSIEFKIFKNKEKSFRNATKTVTSFLIMAYDIKKGDLILEKKISHSDSFVKEFNTILIDFFSKHGIAKNIIVTNLFDAFVVRSAGGNKVKVIKSICKNIDEIINETPTIDA